MKRDNRALPPVLPLVLIFSILIIFFSQQPVHAGKQPYPDLIDRITYEIIEILKKHGLPVERNKDNPWIACSAVPGKYTIYYSQADEIPYAAKIETILYFMKIYEERGRVERFRLKMYRETEAEQRRLFSGIEPYFEMTIGGDN